MSAVERQRPKVRRRPKEDGSSNFTAFRTGPSKSRLAFLSRLCGGTSLWVINQAALDYMKGRDLSQIVIDKFIAHEARIFASSGEWERHLQALALGASKALAGSRLDRQRGGAVGRSPSSGLAAGHGDRLRRRRPVPRRRACAVLGSRRAACSQAHSRQRQAAQRRRGRQADDLVVLSLLERLQARARPRTGRVLGLPLRPHLQARANRLRHARQPVERLHRHKDELLRVLERPEIPLNTNASENDIRAFVTKRKISGGTVSDKGRDARDVMLGWPKPA